MENPERIIVEVIYALPSEQRVFTIALSQRATVRDAVEQSGILGHYTQIDIATAKFGVFGQRVNADAVLRTGDRVEIYRELSADPKVVRRLRVEKKRKQVRNNTP